MAITHEQFEEIYTAYSDAVFRYCYFKIRDREIAKEIMQEAFMKTWKYSVDGNSIANVRAFVYRVAHNLVLNEARKKNRHVSLEEMNETSGYDVPDEQAASADLLADSKRAMELMNEMNPHDVSLLTLRYVDGFSLKEIAEMYEERENSVAVRIHRAIKSLRKKFN